LHIAASKKNALVLVWSASSPWTGQLAGPGFSAILIIIIIDQLCIALQQFFNLRFGPLLIVTER
jgi:hypothetical protein